jgi:hypothetical protein
VQVRPTAPVKRKTATSKCSMTVASADKPAPKTERTH